MVYGNALNQYKRSDIETSGKLDLIIMCYEKAIQLLLQAKSHLQENQIDQKARKMQKALDIINELQSCLNLKKGGQIANNLDAIYIYMIKRLLLGDIKKDHTAYEETVNILNNLKEAWEAIASKGNHTDNINILDTPLVEGIERRQIAA